MKIAVWSLCFAALLAFAVADSDAGHFIPKAFYTLDSDGHKSNLHAVNPNTAHYLRRLRRQVMSTLSSSSPVSETANAQIPDAQFSRDFSSSNDGLPSGHALQASGIIDQD